MTNIKPYIILYNVKCISPVNDIIASSTVCYYLHLVLANGENMKINCSPAAP